MSARARLLLLGGLLGLVLLLWALQGGSLALWLSTQAAPEPLAGLALLRAGVLLALATLLSEDLTCIAAGGLVAQGRLAFAPAALACFAGILVGDVLLFLCGRWLGPRVLARAPLAWFLDARRVAEATRWLERRGALVILASRFLPGARLPTYFASGALGMGPWRFTLFFALAGLLWTPLVVALAAGLGGGLGRLEFLRGRGAWVLLGTLAAGWALLALLRALSTWRGRALLAARWRRVTRFEYWPLGLYYLPVFALVLARALRGQGLAFSAVNPCLPHGGFVGESKRAIYAQLAAAEAPLPRMLFLEAGEPLAARCARALAFRRAHGLPWPLVVKPDAGQRGEGVRIVHDEAGLEAALAASDELLVLQEFVPGAEFGLFYVRVPHAAAGRLLSLTRKVLPEVVGDGRSALERLILAHPEHRALAPLFLARPRAELERVPSAGERVRLGELGTHCRGARFLDGGALATAALLAELERIVAALPGFHLGRFDVRAASDGELARGRFTILELNGVTSEAAHVYDPSHGVLYAWRVLLEQWRLAYAIGAENARRGARVSTLRELLQAVRAYRALSAARGRGAGATESAAARAAEARP